MEHTTNTEPKDHAKAPEPSANSHTVPPRDDLQNFGKGSNWLPHPF